MAEKKEKSKEEEGKIPVFTVLKKGIILKNIILNNPPPLPESQSSNDDSENGENPNQEDEILLVGRHPDCHIVLDHPSISRFHLQIKSQPSSQRLSVIDLSSVHGTWVSGRKIEPQVGVEMSEGDTLRLGASTRIYKLLWVPLSHAFEIEKPFISPEAAPEEKEEKCQDGILMSPVKKQNDSWRMQIPSAPPVPESMNSSSPDEVSSDAKMPMKRENLTLKEDSFTAQSLFKVENKSPESRSEQKHWAVSLAAESVDSSMPAEVCFEADAQSERQDRSQEVCFTTEVLLSDTRKNESPPISRFEQWKMASSHQSRRCRPVSFLCVQTGRTGEETVEGSDAVIELENQQENTDFEQCKKEEPFCKLLFEESFQLDKENLTPMTSTGPKSKKGSPEKVDEGSDAVIEMENQKENANFEQCEREELLCKALFEEQSFQSDKENLTPITSAGLKSNKGSLEMTQMELQKSSSKGEELLCKDLLEEFFQSDKENLTPVISVSLKSKKGSHEMKPMELQKSPLKGEELLCKDLLEESFQSDKVNLTPVTSVGLKSKKGCLEIKQMELQKSSSKGIVAGLDVEEDVFPSDKENLTPNLSKDSKLKKPTSKSRPRFKLDMMKKNAERVPFQSLLESSIDKSKSVSILNATSRNSNSIGHSQTNGNSSTSSASQSVDQAAHKLGEGKKKWNMVVDTSCLLNEESRRSLKLLEGLKGTHLIIPRMGNWIYLLN